MSDLAGFRSGLVSALQGLNASGWDLASGRVLDGMVPLSKATGLTLWYTCLPSGSGGSGSLAILRAGESLGRLRVGLPRFSCAVDIYCAMDADANDTLSGITSFVETVRKALDDMLNGGTTYGAPEFLRAGRVVVARYTLTCVGLTCEAYTRWLRNESSIPVLNESGKVIFV